LRVCAQTILPPNSGNSSSNFNAIDSAYPEPVTVITAQQGHIYTKLAGVAFPLDVIAFANSGTGTTINTAYVNPVTVQLIDDSTPSNSANSSTASCNANATNCNACTDPVIASQVVNFTASQQGQAVTANFTVPNAYSRMLALICQGSTCTGSTTIACSADAFTIRPTSLSVSSTTTNNTGYTGGTVGSGMYLAGTTPFGLNVSTATAHYTGIPQMNAAAMQADNTGWVLGTFSPTSFGAANATGAATGFNSGVTTNFTYSDVGHFSFLAYNPTYDTSSLRGIDDENWTGPGNVTPAPGLLSSNDAFRGDCNGSATNLTGAYSNTIDSNGKYGCFFGLVSSNANSSPSLSTFGRFVPDHFALISGAVTPAVTAPVVAGTVTNFTYMGDPALGIAYTLNACAGAGPGCSSITANYSQSLGYPVSAPVLVAEDGANQGINLAQRISLGVTAPVWASGVYQLSAPNATFALPTTQPGGLLTTPGILTAGGPFDSLAIGVNMTDANSGNVSVIYGNDMDVTTTGTCTSTCSAKQIGTTTSVRQGRLTLANAYGSELLTLPVAVTAQYYDSTKANWLTNTADNAKGSSVAGATTIPAGAAFITNKIATLSGSTAPNVQFVASQGSTASPSNTSPALSLSNGVGAYYLYDTNAKQGSADIAINLGVASPANDVSCNPEPGHMPGAAASWLQYPWCVATPTEHDPNARLKFGSPKTPYIYLREMY
jgi:MSHA biogenesis protein MshQ